MEPLPTIDQNLCTGCHLCVDICPTQALAQVAGKAFLAHAERCTYCTVCEDVCPEDAIALPFLIVLAPQAAKQQRPALDRAHHLPAAHLRSPRGLVGGAGDSQTAGAGSVTADR